MTSTPEAESHRSSLDANTSWVWELPGAAEKREHGRTVERSAVSLLSLMIAAVVSGVVWAAPLHYSATAQSFVAMGPESAAGMDPYGASVFVLQRMRTYAELGTSTPVLTAALEQTGANRSLHDLESTVSVEAPPLSVLLTVKVTDTDPEVAADLANSILVQQARAAEAYDAGNAVTDAPIRVTPTTIADVPRTSPGWFRVLRALIPGLLVGGATLAATIIYLRRRGRTPADIRRPLRVNGEGF